jgi:hypothetical protein
VVVFAPFVAEEVAFELRSGAFGDDEAGDRSLCAIFFGGALVVKVSGPHASNDESALFSFLQDARHNDNMAPSAKILMLIMLIINDRLSECWNE